MLLAWVGPIRADDGVHADDRAGPDALWIDSPTALRDQFGATGGLASTAEELQVAIVVSARRLRRIKPWEQAIRELDEDLPLVRVADVPQSAPAEFESVAAKLSKRLPEDVNVLIDLEGLWAAAFELDASVPNILLFDGRGNLLARHAGMFNEDLRSAFAADLNRYAQSP